MITGDAAVKFFEGFKLPTLTLGQIWSIADSSNNGFLTPNAFAVALRLIARAQRGESIGESEVQIPGAPPVYEGAGAPAASGAPAAGSEVPITPEDKARFSRIFATVGPTNGLLSGDQAKEVFMKSKLPFSKLGAIWNLADTKARGALDLTDFVIGMYYIQGSMNGTIPSIPPALPAGLYEQASGAPPPPLQPQPTGTDHLAAAFNQPPAAAKSVPPAAPSVAPSIAPSAPSAQSLADASRSSSYTSVRALNDWAITPQEKAKFDSFFDSLDTGKTGAIEGPMAVPFFMQSGLDEPTLAHVWDLSDLTQNGELSRDEFALAMRLINDKLEGKALPEQLPASYLPPSMRTRDLPEAVDVKQTETQKELFSLLDTDAPVMSPSVAATAFGGNAREAPTKSAPAPAPVPAARAPAPAAPSTTAPAAPSATASRAATAFNAFDDDFDAPTPMSSGADIGNAQNALESTNKSLDELKTRRATAESTAARNATSLQELEAQLARARTEHESETAAVRELEERVQSQTTELDALRQEVIRTESELSAARTQKDELEQKLLQDRESLRETKRQLAELQSETARMREEKERIAKEARQHAGLAAIASKQLATAQAEHESVRAMPTEPTREVGSSAATPTGVATPGSSRYNPFEALAATQVPVSEPSSARGTFESQYGVYNDAAASTTSVVDPAESSDDDEEGPEDVDGARSAADTYAAGERTPPAPAPVAVPVPVATPTSAPVRSAAPALAPEAKESISLPGGFPGEADVESNRTSVASQPPNSGGATAPAPTSVPPPPSEPLVVPPASTQPPTLNPVERAPTTWSTSATVASTPAATPGPTTLPGAQASSKTPSGLDDFDSAFANLGLAHVVQSTPSANPTGASPYTDTFDSFEENFSTSFAPSTPKSTAAPVASTSNAPPVPQRSVSGATSSSTAPSAQPVPVPVPVPAPARKSATAPAPAAAPAPVGGSNFASPLSYLSSTTMAPRADATDLPGVRKAQDPTQGDTYGTMSGRPPVVIGSPTSASTGSAPSAAPTESAAPTSAAKPAAASTSPPPSYPPAESAPSSQVRAPSPALPDDVGPVRQLCQMGFSRTQVVRALERCGYRTERALEHLLSNSGRA